MKKLISGVTVWFACAVACFAAEAGVLTQWSTIDALLRGYYDGVVTLGEVKKSGDFGLGTFEQLDGEMLLLDGKVYQVDGSGAVKEPGDEVRTPFAAVAVFRGDLELTLPAGLTLAQVQERIEAALPSKNVFYAVRMTGAFAEVKTRSVKRQAKPYPLLSEVVKTQALFSFAAVSGDAAGLWCPQYAKGVNVPGWHFHFLKADRTGGGHVLGLTTGEGGVRVRIAVLREFAMKLPASAEFDVLDLSGDKAAELHAVESDRAPTTGGK